MARSYSAGGLRGDLDADVRGQYAEIATPSAGNNSALLQATRYVHLTVLY